MSMLNDMRPEDYAKIINGVCIKLKSNPDETAMRNITLFCKKRDLQKLEKQYPRREDLINHLIERYVTHVTTDYSAEQDKLIDDYNRKINLRLPTKEILSLKPTRSMHIVIDSINRDISNDNNKTITDFRFTLSERNDRSLIGTGRIPARLIPINVTYMKIGRIILPYDSIISDRNYTHELTLTFTGLRSNGAIVSNLITNETIHFNFTYKVCDYNDNLVELTPVNKYCKFDPPLTYIDDLSLRFNEPRYPVMFPYDRLYPTQLNYLSSDGRIVFDKPHGLMHDDIILVTGFITNDDTKNTEILASVTDPRGIKVSLITSNMIATNIDFTTIVNPNIDVLPLIIFVSKTFRIPLEIGFKDTDEHA